LNKSTKSPSFESLALKYKTISRKQLDYARVILDKKKKKIPDITIEEILVEKEFATSEQVNLLKFILEFLRLKEQSKKFGRLSVKMGYTTQQQVDDALKKQHLEFRQLKIKKMIGDILVESGTITPEQKDAITEEQQRLSRYSRKKKDKDGGTLPRNLNKRVSQKLPDLPADHPIEVIISENFMEAWIKLSDNPSNKISLDAIKNILREKNVTFGIYNDFLLQNYVDNKTKFFMVAEGEYPPVHKNMAVKYLFSTQESKLISHFKEADIKVKRGETLAVLDVENIVPDGRNIFGKYIDRRIYEHHTPSVFRCGKGTRISKDNVKAFAGRSGSPFLSIDNKLYVLSVTNVFEDADLKFGPIEEFSDLNVSGILTGAFPVKAGKITAREIRGARIKALKDIVVKVGITNAKIRTQGNIYAKYIHNSTIDAFGDVIVEHEIIDSAITISGKCKAEKSRIIASVISAKQGIIAAGVGSDVTESCILGAGREDHIILETERITHKIELAEEKLTELNKKKDRLIEQGRGIFKEMAELKRFYDRVKKELDGVGDAPRQNSPDSDKINFIKTTELKDDLNKKIETIIISLKALNKKKHSIEVQQYEVGKIIKNIKPGLINKAMEYKRDRTVLLKWAEKTPGLPEIGIKGRVARGTVFKGAFTSMTVREEYNNIKLVEKCKSENNEWKFVIEDTGLL